MATTPEWKIKKRLVYKQKNEIIKSYKTDKGCSICGERNPVCLELHHKDMKNKLKLLVGNGRTIAWLAWKHFYSEIEKCEVLCANCHRIKHHEETSVIDKGGDDEGKTEV
jgi:hypothetical protein